MKKRFKLISLLLLSLLLFGLVGCGDNKSNDSTTKNPPTNQEYFDYLTERYNHYFNNSDLDTTYDIYVDDFTYDDEYYEFVTGYTDSYSQLKTNLEAFKSDLENNVVKGNAEVDKYNQDVITATDKAIIAVDDYNGSFAEKTKDYATLSKDEVVKGLRNLTLKAHDARIDLKNLVNDAKNKLGIK
ncbi:hypothetical protein [uncultured Clostridium sp.]|uniref:hypothetical protein n=1 Tax=uncultured Clostridium sp. TaxID=59620 RepID=UPI0026019E2D|nr:hypothetical protein [uncultured Clostridium sp.]